MECCKDDASQWWTLYDIMLTAYCSMMALGSKIAVLQSGAHTMCEETATGLLSISNARNILKVALLGFRSYMTPTTASYAFGAFRCYVAYGCLAKYLFNSHPKERGATAAADMALLEQIAQRMSTIAEGDQDLAPLAGTFHELNMGIYIKWGERMESL